MTRSPLRRPLRFPDFGLLRWFVEHASKRYQISPSGIRAYALSEFRRPMPDMGLDSPPEGTPELRKAIAKLHGVDPERVVVTNGATEANFVACAALVEPGDSVAVERPGYAGLGNMPEGLGARVVRIERPPERFDLDVDGLAAALPPGTRSVVLTNLNNPSSSLTSASELRRLADLAEDRDLTLIVDETFRELAFERAPPTIAGMTDRAVVTGTMTKAYGLGGLRIGWVIAEPGRLARIRNVHDYTSIAANILGDVVARWALARRRSLLRRAKSIVEENRKVALEWLEGQPFAHLEMPAWGTVCFPRVDVDVDRLAEVAADRFDTVLAPGRFFGTPERFRLGLGGDTDALREGLRRLDRAIAEIR